MKTLQLRLSAFALAASGFMSGSAAFAQNAECQLDDDCEHGFACHVYAMSDCAMVDCAPGEACEPVDCAPSSYGSCEPISGCEEDLDCAEGMLCAAQESETCSGMVMCPADEECPPLDVVCDVEIETQCTPRAQLPCSEAADCGEGYECEIDESCSCGDFAAPAESGDADAAVDGGSTYSCVCEPNGPSWCRAKTIECNTDSECPSDWTCQAQIAQPEPGEGPADDPYADDEAYADDETYAEPDVDDSEARDDAFEPVATDDTSDVTDSPFPDDETDDSFAPNTDAGAADPVEITSGFCVPPYGGVQPPTAEPGIPSDNDEDNGEVTPGDGDLPAGDDGVADNTSDDDGAEDPNDGNSEPAPLDGGDAGPDAPVANDGEKPDTDTAKDEDETKDPITAPNDLDEEDEDKGDVSTDKDEDDVKGDKDEDDLEGDKDESATDKADAGAETTKDGVDEDDDGGCSVAAAPKSNASSSAWLLGLVGLAFLRRRR